MRQLMLVVATIFATWSADAGAGADADAIRHLLHATFDKPDARLVVAPVVVTEGYAIAGWTQGDMGGRALLHHQHGRWTLVLCAGDGIKSAEALRHAGLAPNAANALAQALAAAEQAVPAERLAMFAKFEGLLRMDEAGNHPPVHHQKH